MEMGQFAWVEFYEELADTLLGYANNRQALLRHLSHAYAKQGFPCRRLTVQVLPRTSTHLQCSASLHEESPTLNAP